MKRILFTLVVMFVALTNSTLEAQQNNNNEYRKGAWCGSVFDAELQADHNEFVDRYYNRGGKEQYQSNGRAMKYVPIAYHLVARTNGTGRRLPSEALNDLCILNQDMLHADIQFYLEPNSRKNNVMINYVDNDGWYTGAPSPNTGQFQLMTSLNNDQSSLNVYQVGSIRDNPGVLGVASGSVFFGGAPNAATSAIFIKNGEGGVDQTFAHECGHNFSLPHTFFGWEGDADYVCGATAGANRERYDGSNCTTAGDQLCDTEPDYIASGFQCSGSVTVHTCQQIDAAGGTGFADGANIMAYGFGCVNKSFSQDQINKMDDHLTQHRAALIASTPSMSTITSAPSLNPADASLYDGVVLDWSAATNATHYAVEISQSATFSSSSGAVIETAVVSGTTYTATELNPGATYRWRVVPFNATDFCASQISSTGVFSTSNFATKVRTIEGVNNVALRPNFTTSGQSVNLIIDAIQSFEADINIYNVQGQLVSQSVQTPFGVGNNVHEINTADFSAGIYFVTVQTETGVINKKLVVTK